MQGPFAGSSGDRGPVTLGWGLILSAAGYRHAAQAGAVAASDHYHRNAWPGDSKNHCLPWRTWSSMERFNLSSEAVLGVTRQLNEALDEHCAEIGRDPLMLFRSGRS